jgi:hypothetical protein
VAKKLTAVWRKLVGAERPPAPRNERDFSSVDSAEKAAGLAERGELFKIFLFPPELGGERVAMNIVYVPSGIPEIKDEITQTLSRLVADGLADGLDVQAEYKGQSVVPSKIHMRTSRSAVAGNFHPTIEVW